jgi:hypothetical protein
MINQNINEVLGKFWGCYIIGINVDIKKLTLLFEINRYEKDGVSKHTIEFCQVSSFFFVNGQGEARLRTEGWENVELSEIYYNEKPKDHINHTHDKVGTPKYYADYNFSLELWSALFLVEAKSAIIDGTIYDVGR